MQRAKKTAVQNGLNGGENRPWRNLQNLGALEELVRALLICFLALFQKSFSPD
jgi:hypothetical protein